MLKWLIVAVSLVCASVITEARHGAPYVAPTGSVSISVAGQANGAISVNNWTGFTSPAGTVFTSSNWGATNTKYLEGNDYHVLMAQTTAAPRDVEVTTYVRNGTVFLRISNGSAIYCRHNGDAGSGSNGLFELGIVTGVLFNSIVNSGESLTGSYFSLYTNSNMNGTVPGYNNAATSGATLTCRASGFTISADFNGVTFASVTDYRIVVPGNVGLWANQNFGFRDVTITYLSAPIINSVPSVSILDIRDFGGRASVSTTGSISSSSNQLALAQSIGVAVGDGIIVETGSENGAGLRGSFGVGGAYPTLSYPNVAAMNADTTKPNSTQCYIVGSLDVYLSTSGVWALQDNNQYYSSKLQPRALVATVTNVANGGTLLTLDKSAAVTATNANVYFNNYTSFNSLAGIPDGGPTPSFIRVSIPNGIFAVSDPAIDASPSINFNAKRGWSVYGQGINNTTIFSPNGTPGANIQETSSDYFNISNLYLIGNAKNNGYGLYWTSGGTIRNFYPRGIFFSGGSNGIAHDFKVTNAFQDAFGTEFAGSPTAYNCAIDLTDGLQIYIQWQIQLADTSSGLVHDCTITSPYLTGGLEGFRTSGFTFQRVTLHNAVVSDNSSGGGFLYEDISVTISPLSQMNSISFANTNPIFNINSNIGPDPSVAAGGTIRRFTAVQTGVINASNDILTTFSIGSDNPNITITGTYPAANGQGCVQAQNWVATTNPLLGIGARTSGTNIVVSGMRFIGQTDYADGIGNIHTEGGSLTSTNNIMDHVVTGSGSITETGTQSNATWNAANPGHPGC